MPPLIAQAVSLLGFKLRVRLDCSNGIIAKSNTSEHSFFLLSLPLPPCRTKGQSNQHQAGLSALSLLCFAGNAATPPLCVSSSLSPALSGVTTYTHTPHLQKRVLPYRVHPHCRSTHNRGASRNGGVLLP